MFRKTLFIAMCVLAACSNSNQSFQEAEKTSSPYFSVNIPEDSEEGQKFAALKRGEAVDVDGDGFAERTLTIDEDGTIHMESITPEGNVYYYKAYYPDRREHSLYDTNKDGLTDIQEDLTFRPEHKRIILTDKDFDGYPEHRRTTIYDHERELKINIEELDDDMDGNYTIIEQWNVDHPSLETLGLPPPTRNIVPKNTSTERLNIKNSSPKIIKTIPCTEEQRKKLEDAYVCSNLRSSRCLSEINKKLSDALWNIHMEKVLGIKDVFVTCGQLDKYSAYANPLEHMSVVIFDPSKKPFRSCGSDDTACRQEEFEDMCSLMLHELLHLTGVPTSSDHDTSQNDQIHACGRYCGFCQPWSHSANVDCAICGGTNEEKYKCGSIEYYEEGNCYASYGVCHAGLACIADACETCQILRVQTCDNISVHEYDFSFHCCSVCPTGCDSSNDFPCYSTPDSQNTCNEKLKHCPSR